MTVSYRGIRVGLLDEARGSILFEYDRDFVLSGHDLSPLRLPLGPGVLARGPLPSPRLPGLFEDSLPDSWGHRIMVEWFRRRGVPEYEVTPLRMLAYVGSGGMGALDYAPAEKVDPQARASLAEVYTAAAAAERDGVVDVELLAGAGSSIGGARPKALVGLPQAGDGPVLAGAGILPPGYAPWIVKFDTSEEASAGPLEEAYARMARAAGIDVPETRLLSTRAGGRTRRHFAVRRFDRDGDERIHHHTLAALLHAGGGDLDYLDLLRVARRLARSEGEVWRAYRRAAFNVLASNRDDHGKNHGFLYRNRVWSLGPAYDLTFVPPERLRERGMAVCGERRRVTLDHLGKLAAVEALDRRQAERVVDEVRNAVSRWRAFAEDAGVPSAVASEIGSALRRDGA